MPDPTREEMIGALRRIIATEEDGRADWPPHSTMTESDLNALQTVLRELEAPRYRHKKRGTTYRLLGEASVQSNNAIFEGEIVVVYRADSDGTLWVRPHYEFNDGRFDPLPAMEASHDRRPDRAEQGSAGGGARSS